MQPFFSIIIPLFNKELSIESTLNSVFNQTFNDFEVIVINDGSTDKSEEKVKANYSRKLNLINTENKGISKARNLGIRISKGKFIAFLDADDYWFSDHLESLYQLHQNFSSAGLLATNYSIFYSDKKTIQPNFDGIPSEKWSGIILDFFKSSMKYRLAWTSAVAVKKEVLDSIGIFDENITVGEDNDLWIRIALKYSIAFDNKVTVYYCMNSENRISLTKTIDKSFPKLDKFLKEEKTNKSLKKFIDLYRSEYALKHKLAGDLNAFYYYKSTLLEENLHWKTKILFKLPVFILRTLYFFKTKLEQLSIHINAYH
jgi:glycosyltransferase involved in cell wall biosynthesis